MASTKSRSIRVSGLGIYNEDFHDTSSTSGYDIDEIDHEQYHRIVLPEEEPPPTLKVESMSQLLITLLQLLFYVTKLAIHHGTVLVRDTLTSLISFVYPPSLETRQQHYIQKHQVHSLSQHWQAVDWLPAYVCEIKLLSLLKQIGHTGDKERTPSASPADFPVKTAVRLQLDPHGRPFVAADIEGISCTLLLDTGASVSVLTQRFFDRLPSKHTLQRFTDIPAIYDHQGNPIPITAGVMCQVTIGHKSLLLPFIVSPKSSSNLIGTNALVGRKLALTHHGHQAELIVGEMAADCRPTLQLAQQSALYAVNDTVLPGDATRTVDVSPFLFPANAEIKNCYLQLMPLDYEEGFVLKTTHAKLKNDGTLQLRLHNNSIIDRDIPRCSIVGFAKYDESYKPPTKPARKEKATPPPPADHLTPTVISDEGNSTGVHQTPAAATESDTTTTIPPAVPTAASLDNTPSLSTPSHQVAEVAPSPPTADSNGTLLEAACHCQLEATTLILRCNGFGDSCLPYLSYIGHHRSPLPSGRAFRFRRGEKQIILLYGETQKDLDKALDACPDGPQVAYITNLDEKTNTGSRTRVRVTGSCSQHPFPYQSQPAFISLVMSDQANSHQFMLARLDKHLTIKLGDLFSEVYWSPEIPEQVHVILHAPDILSMKTGLLHNIVGALVMPLSSRLKIMEVYSAPPTYQNVNFNNIIYKVARLHKATLQSRNPLRESKVYTTSMVPLKQCVCPFCLPEQDKRAYQIE
jgi:hypothetical protein